LAAKRNCFDDLSYAFLKEKAIETIQTNFTDK